jgi:hypothetical protein
MEQKKWFRASLRISGENLQPDDVGRLLSLKPTRTHLRGQPRGRQGKSAQHIWNYSLWLLESPLDDDRDPAEHLKWLLDILVPKVSLIKTLSENYHVDLFCGFSSGSGQGGVTLDAIMLQRIAHLGLPLILDLYPPESPDV